MSQYPSPHAPVAAPAVGPDRARTSLLLNAGTVTVMWLLELLDSISGHALDAFGLRSWALDDVWGVFTAPWLHLGWQHLANNSVPLLVLGFLVALAGLRRWVVTALVVVLCSGLAAWLLSPPGTMTLGASGLVFGFLGYLLVRGWWTRDWRQVLVGLVVFTVYGSILWGVLPTDPSVSWQGHLGGFAGGVLAAWLQHGRTARAR